MPYFVDFLEETVNQKKSLICVGLDPHPDQMQVDDLYEFCESIVTEVSPYVSAIKPNLAFFEAFGIQGLKTLEKVVKFVREINPELILIGDAKRGDISSSMERYAKSIFEQWDFDAATVNPFAGRDSIDPFLQYEDKGVFVWCKSSNPDGYQFQNIGDTTRNGNGKVYEMIAREANDWNFNKNVGLVVGATYPNELESIRQISPDIPILVPGIGSQDGDLHASIVGGISPSRYNLIISSSRSIIYASDNPVDYGMAAGMAAKKLKNQVNDVLLKIERPI